MSVAEMIETRTDAVFLNGRFHAGKGALRDAVNPATGEAFARFATATPGDVTAAAESAERAFGTWRRLPVAERARFLRGFAEGLDARRDALIELQMRNNGKPRFEAEIDLGDAAACFRYYADLIEGGALDRDRVVLPDDGFTGRQVLEPYGPAALIVPWNFPLVTTAWKLAPALAAGCTALLKPSEFTTLAELVYGEIAQEIGLPDGVLSILPGEGAIGAAMLDAPQVRKASFTGSNATGARIMGAAANRLLPVSLELGGKSPIVVLSDADIETAAELVCGGIFFNAGQICSATSRLIVDEAIADDLIAALRARIRKMAVGDPRGEIDMGPLTTMAQRDKVLGYLLAARSEGLDCLCGGTGALGPGFFIEPTVYLDVPETSALWREEIFGPVLSVRRVKGDEAAIALANATDYGLAATVVGGDPARANAVADRIDAGHVWVNTMQIIFPETSWGGFKASGIGRELGFGGLQGYAALKHITTPA
ncbi:aldehyde dehydrogenase family protein [Yangia mangrovi]|uniref:aldehyde dehydrogenase (NAD(+)) n=1 Tax=Alloyangia mangrovi TaxID=1779329 RepID=A0ABT2KMF6_9RHOB|nr:aldehyde dehydrogenase family protein [Alloyangia mangrovi]MCT4371360.1 aldehyde dehydrogenase family protein [Alloyangia mangrovi]